MTEPISRDELLSGRLAQHRRAQRIAGSIESRVLYMRDETRRALDAYFLGDFSTYRRGLDRDYFAVIRQRASSSGPLLAGDLERFTPQWRMLAPREPELAAAVLQALISKLGLTEDSAPEALAALGASDPTVRGAYWDAFGAIPEDRLPVSAPNRGLTEGLDDTPLALRMIEDHAEWLTLPGGQRLFAAGDPGDALYLVVSGRFRVLQEGGDGDDFVAEIGRGEVVGEMGALTGEPRSADVVAARDSEVIRIAQSRLLQVAATAPEILLRINHDLVNRLRQTTAGIAPPPAATSYAIVPATPGAPVREIARQLAEAMRGIGTTAHITQTLVQSHSNPDAGGGPPVFSDPELIAWLAEQESSHHYVLYEGEAGLTPWTRRCIRQADRILLVADADDDPEPSLIDETIASAGSRPDVELLLVHPTETERPTGTARWLGVHDLQAHHHLRRGDDAQLRHVARMLTGTALGLALGGGGARGAAHIGLVRALEERGIEIDLIGGTSMGALVGALFGEGLSAHEAARRLSAVTTQQRLLDWTLPLVAFTSGGRVAQALRREWASLRIEDLWRPFFCVSTDLTHAKAVVHRRGSLWTAVRASISIPGVFAPVLSPQGTLLVDGGIMNTLPIDLVREARGIGTVIGSNVTPDREADDQYNFGTQVSGWRVALERVPGMRSRQRTPSIVNTLIRANEVRGVALNRNAEFAAQADLIVQPPVESFPTLDFKRTPELVEIGYRASGEALDAWDGLSEVLALHAPGRATDEVNRASR